MKKIHKHIILICMLLFFALPGSGTISLITLTPASPTTMSTGNDYYLAGNTYNFSVNVVDNDIADWVNITNVSLTIANTPNIDIDLNAITGGGAGTAHTASVTGLGTAVTIPVIVYGSCNNFTVEFQVPVRWDTTDTAYSTGRTISTSATTNMPGSNTSTVSTTLDYGVCTSMRVLNFQQDGVAADGYVNPYFTPFNVTGTLVYNIPGATASDAVTAAAITDSELYIDGTTASTFTGDANDNTPSYTVNNSGTPITALNGTHAWYIRLNGGTYGTEMSVNSLAIIQDEVQVTIVNVTGGAGRTISALPIGIFFRSLIVPGSQIQITARMRYSGTGMFGNTTLRIYDTNDTTGQTSFDVTIPNGANTGIVTVNATVGAGNTVDHIYRVGGDPGYTPTNNIYSVSGIWGIYGGLTDNEQNTYTEITQPGNVVTGSNTIIRWENGDPPGANTPYFTTMGAVTSTSNTITLNWTALDNPALNDSDGDFDSYKIYYRESGSTVWTIVDRNTAGFASLGNYSTSSTTIQGLQVLATYDYRISAVDIFGNEVASANMLPSGNTLASYTTVPTTSVTITDGIVKYTFDTSNNPVDNDPVTTYPLRRSAIRIDLNIVTQGNTPDNVDLLVANNSTDVIGTQFGTTGGADLITGTTYYTIPCSRTAPNIWTAYLSTTDPLKGSALVAVNTTIRFIIRIHYGAGYVYYDSMDETYPTPGNYTNREFRFHIAEEPNFTPWPTRILNNVITDDNPVAYPSYYLTDDAYVTITAYDIKGRPVAMLLDNAWRPAGQNIKEQGWAGTNKNRKKLGVGLYYIRIVAKRASDGKVLIDKFSKIVVAK